MIKTQVQLPDRLYREAKRVAAEREMSLAEVIRRGLEYITAAYPPLADVRPGEWTPPAARRLGAFRSPADTWRELASELGPEP
jgi:hypothetical protein